MKCETETKWRPLCSETLRWCAVHLSDTRVAAVKSLGSTKGGSGFAEFVDITLLDLNKVYADQWNRLEREVRELNRICLYFGTWRGAGHYFRDANGNRDRDDVAAQPFSYPDGTHQPDNGQVQGPAALRHEKGWTILAWWDRTEDTRGNCCSALVFEGEHSFETMVQVLEERFNRVFVRRRLTKWHGKIMKEVERR